jgi:ABC-2 type transport system permease protein
VSAATQIAAKDLKLRLRDRSAVITGIVAPLVLAFIFSAVFGGAFDTSTGLGLEYGVVNLDQGEVSDTFVQVLQQIESDGIITLETFADSSAAESAVSSGEIDTFFFLDHGFGQAVLAGQTPTIEVVGDIDAPTSTQIAASIAGQYATGVGATQLAILTTATQMSHFITPDFIASLNGDPESAAMSYQFTSIETATRQLDGTTYFAAGMAVFFLFFTVQFGVLGLLEEERDGTMARLIAAPIGRSSVVVGKAILAFVLGAISMTVLILSTAFLMGADWGAPLGVVVLVVSGVLAAVGIMGLIAAIAKTPEGAGNLGAIIAVVLGMLGGVFFPIGQGDNLLSKLTFATPHAWFMRGLGDLADGAPWTAALPSVGAILVFATVCGGLASVSLQRRMRR